MPVKILKSTKKFGAVTNIELETMKRAKNRGAAAKGTRTYETEDKKTESPSIVALKSPTLLAGKV